jgi:hypothetical protein
VDLHTLPSDGSVLLCLAMAVVSFLRSFVNGFLIFGLCLRTLEHWMDEKWYFPDYLALVTE